MAHLSDDVRPLQIVDKGSSIIQQINSSEPSVELILLPFHKLTEEIQHNLFSNLDLFINNTHDKSTIAILCSPIFAANYCSRFSGAAQLKLWIAIKLDKPIVEHNKLNQAHTALLIFTRYKESLKHTKTRIGYTYCPCCEKTTKDYGGKKHLYHEFGTLMSDVWRDITVNHSEYPYEVIDRLKDLFGISDYQKLGVYDIRKAYLPHKNTKHTFLRFSNNAIQIKESSKLINGDSLSELKKIPDNSIDFCFADPPYNLSKSYENWDDNFDIKSYFEWCDKWLFELARILKPHHTLAVLNIPQWCIRHYKYLKTILDYQDWIVWEGLSMPVRMIMPAHYSILCFSKGEPRPIPGIIRDKISFVENKSIMSLAESYCLRSACIQQRKYLNNQDTILSSNLWWDIHRLKHNSRRVDHPCQLPPSFMRRLISIFTNEDEIVLDPFNGVGTTSLTAQELGRKYIGIELSDYYHKIAINRHEELSIGLDPFRKNNDISPKAKNSPVARLKKQTYVVPKKVLQLEVKKISTSLGRMPTRDDVIQFSKYPISYFDEYFINWAEVTAAARTTGMTEDKNNNILQKYQAPDAFQLSLFEKRKKYLAKSRKNVVLA